MSITMNIVVAGCSGHMGRTTLRCLQQNPHTTLIGGTVRPGSQANGTDLGTLAGTPPTGLTATTNTTDLFARADGVIDFSTPEAATDHAALAAQARLIHVIGVTGLSDQHEQRIKAAGRHAVIIKSGNTSLGVTLLADLVRQAAQRLDESWDIEISETHHRRKQDAPSGTALLLGQAAAEGRDVRLADVARRQRDGHTGARPTGEIGFAVRRGGTITGDHQVLFAGDNEQVALTHVAEDRSIFSNGAIRACLWGQGKSPGVYSMAAVLGLKETS